MKAKTISIILFNTVKMRGATSIAELPSEIASVTEFWPTVKV